MKVTPSLSIRFRLRNHEAPKDAIKPKVLYCVVILNKERCEYSTGQKIISKYWDSINEKSKESNPDFSKVNLFLETIRQDIAKVYYKSKIENQQLTFEKIRNDVFLKHNYKSSESPSRKENLKFLIAKYLDDLKLKCDVGQAAKLTFRGYSSAFKWLDKYLSQLPNSDNLTIEELNIDFFSSYERFLLSQETLSRNNVNKLMRVVKIFLNFIYFNGWITKKIDFRISTKYVTPTRPIIPFEIINHLMKLNLVANSLSETRDLFLFQVFCGTAYADLKNLTRDNIKIIQGRTWLILERKKTGTVQKLVLLPQAYDLIEKYKDHPYCINTNQLMPMKSNSNYNLALKKLQKAAGIDIPLTSHLGRHCFATTVALGNDLNMESLMRAMGHKNMKVTVQYAKVIDEKIARDFDKLNDSLISRLNELNDTKPLSKT